MVERANGESRTDHVIPSGLSLPSPPGDKEIGALARHDPNPEDWELELAATQGKSSLRTGIYYTRMDSRATTPSSS